LTSPERLHSQANTFACLKVDTAKAAELRRVVPAVKIKIADAARHASREAVPLHGGMGMTEELTISHTFRSLTTIAQAFDDADHHLEAFAACDGSR
jgi:alkylation response protein AidB-like acyl-CoA dehydrogenase